MLQTGNRGFTLIEVMAAAGVLALGSVLIYEAFFISLDSYEYCVNFLQVSSWQDELVWEARDALVHPEGAGSLQTQGHFVNNNNKRIDWGLSFSSIDELKEAERQSTLFRIDSGTSWKQGQRVVSLSRNTYALYRKRK
jgi:prepilin-type N-terminal cleavage/methylation domain-containing protein